MKIVVKLGGFAFPLKINEEIINSFALKFKEIHETGHKLTVVTGGGEAARVYINAARKLGASESFCDQLGILVSRLNAKLLIASLNDLAAPKIPETLEEFQSLLPLEKIIVMGGLQPGHSTNAVAALIAESIKADLLINVTDVDGVYTKDPKKDPEAKLLKEVNINQLQEILSSSEVKAGTYKLLDLLAIKIIERSKIPTWIINGRNPSNLIKVIKGEKIGTKILT
ncbi:MAG: UMP kinase [Candidatus Bathyarchaeia archaeon]|nr:UMP kinase [Candidatus Bathyarchaeota archaeon]